MGVRRRGAKRLRGELAHGLDQPEKPPGRARLSDRELATRGVVRERAVVGERMRPYEVRSLALAAEAEIFKLQHRYDRIIVVGLDEIDLLRRCGVHRTQFH